MVNEYKKLEGLSAATIRVRMAYVRAECRYAYKHHKFCTHDPAERVSMPTVKNERHVYASRKEVLLFARAIKRPAIRATLLIAFYSGMRLAEVLRVKIWNDAFLLEDTKNGERRVIPIHFKLKRYIEHIPIKPARSTIQKWIRIATRKCGHDDLHFHDMPHSAASEMIDAGVDLYTVGGVLGHKSAHSLQSGTVIWRPRHSLKL